LHFSTDCVVKPTSVFSKWYVVLRVETNIDTGRQKTAERNRKCVHATKAPLTKGACNQPSVTDQFARKCMTK